MLLSCERDTVIYDVNLPFLAVFQRCQWSRTFDGLADRIDPAQVEVVARAVGMPFDVELLDAIADMAAAARPIINAGAKQAPKPAPRARR